MIDRKYRGVDWNTPENEWVEEFWNQNVTQFWISEEISLIQDLASWEKLSSLEKDSYGKNLAILTAFDTYQGNIGMLSLIEALEDDKYLQTKAVLAFMEAMENVHAKSYSTIFSSLLSKEESDKLFDWGEEQKNLQRLMNIIMGNYKKLQRMTACKKFNFEEVDNFDFKKQTWKTMVTSVFLESCLFYSGFFYPLLEYGRGRLMGCGEMINLILR